MLTNKDVIVCVHECSHVHKHQLTCADNRTVNQYMSMNIYLPYYIIIKPNTFWDGR